MKSFSYLPFFVLLLSISVFAQEPDFVRDTIPINAAFEIGGYGNIAAGYDLDGDGKMEIYAVNHNADDRPGEMIPRIYKFEFNGTTWDSVWGAALDIPLQNTWPAFTIGDLDGDGKMELIWGPVNNISTENPNPARVVIFEAPGGDVEYMGVDDGTGTGNYLPNIQYSMVEEDNVNIRPFRFITSDIDSDDKNELLLVDRAAATGYGMHFAVLSVSDVPDNGDGSEVWTVEFSGKDNPAFTGTGGKYDIAALNNYVYLFDDDGLITPIKYENNTWTVLSAPKLADSAGSWHSSQVVDIDKDGTYEIVYGGWYNGRIYLLQPEDDSLVASQIADFTNLGMTRIMGGDNGDVDGDGEIDFVFGSRYESSTPNNSIGWVKYLGGDITDSNNYAIKLIDSLYFPLYHDMDLFSIANLDPDSPDEIVYSSSYPRKDNDNIPTDIIILNYAKDISIKPITEIAPNNYFLDQNFPNPFNPVTTIRFGLKTEAPVNLKIFDILGREVAVLIHNTTMKPGEYDVTFDASSMASGTYIYKLTAGDVSVSKKMSLLK